MKTRILLTLLFTWTVFTAWAQLPPSFTYQAVARDGAGELLANKTIGLRLSVLDGNTALYVETHMTQTNAYGVFTVNIGAGGTVSGSFTGINWSEGTAKSLKTEMDATGGTNYVTMGTTPFSSVPFALVAGKVTSMSLDQLSDVSAATPQTNQVLQWNGTSWVAATPAAGSTVSTTAALSGDGSAASPLNIAQQGATSGQVLQWSGTNWSPATLTGGAGDNWGTQFALTNVTLSGNGTNASPLGIAQQGALNGESLIWNGSLWTPGRPTVSVDGTLAGAGTPLSPIRIGQQGAATGDVLKWNGTTWLPGAPLTLPYNQTVSLNSASAFVVTNNGPGGTAITAQVLNGGTGNAVGGFHNGAGTGVRGVTDSGVGVLGQAGTSGLAGKFEGNTAVVNGVLTVGGAQVLKSSDVYLFDQSSALNVETGTATVIPGLGAMNFTVENSASVSTPAKVMFTFNGPFFGTTSTATGGEAFIVQLIIKQGASTVKQLGVNEVVPALKQVGLSYTMHHKITTPGSYTAIVQVLKADASASKNISISESQVQIQVVH